MFDTVIFLHAGGGIAMTMAGIGALKFFISSSNSVARVPDALERTAAAQEKQAVASEQSAELAKSMGSVATLVDRLAETVTRDHRVLFTNIQAAHRRLDNVEGDLRAEIEGTPI